MIQFKKEDIESKSTDELLKHFHESRFHHQDYISLAIEVLFERGLTRTILFEKKATQDLVNAICFDSDKHKNNYLQLVKEELEDRNYDVSSIPDIKNPETFSSVINARDKEIKSNLNSNYSSSNSNKTTFETETTAKIKNEYNSTERDTNFTQESKSEFSQNEKVGNKNKYVGLSIAAIIMVVIKLGLMYAREQADEKQNQKISEESRNNEKIQDFYEFKSETINLLFQTDGSLNQRLKSFEEAFEKMKLEDDGFKIGSIDELIRSERIEISKILKPYDDSSLVSNYGNSKVNDLKHEISERYFLEFNKILALYE
jgi:hypothetical protein